MRIRSPNPLPDVVPGWPMDQAGAGVRRDGSPVGGRSRPRHARHAARCEVNGMNVRSHPEVHRRAHGAASHPAGEKKQKASSEWFFGSRRRGSRFTPGGQTDRG